jgi:hypothetical protein
MSSIRISKSLKAALKGIALSKQSYEKTIADLRNYFLLSAFEKAVKTVYDEKSLVKNFIGRTVKPLKLNEIDFGHLSVNEEAVWEDGNTDIIVPVIHKSFHTKNDAKIDEIKSEAIKALNILLETETKLLSKASDEDKLYLLSPLELVGWNDQEYNMHFNLRVALNTSATPHFEDFVNI